jgi:hypothetical protein
MTGCIPANIKTEPPLSIQTISPATEGVYSQKPYSQETVQPTGTVMSTANIETKNTPLPTPIPTSTREPGINPVPLQLPDLVMSNGEYQDDCARQVPNEIWLSSAPFEEARPLLQDPAIDYNLPEWSPDGEWVAYVRADLINDKNLTGEESIWIMRPDGSDQKELGVPLPTVIEEWGNGCDLMSKVESPLLWSPDGKRIVFMHRDARLSRPYRYYVVDVATGQMQTIVSQNRKSAPVWVSEHELALVGDANEIQLITVSETKENLGYIISPPPGIPDEWIFTLSFGFRYAEVESRRLIGSFYQEGTWDSVLPKFQSEWEIDLNTRQWQKRNETFHEAEAAPFLGGEVKLSCLRGHLDVLAPVGGAMIRSIEIPAGFTIDCESFGLYQDLVGNQFASFNASVSEDHYIQEDGIWALNLRSLEMPNLVFSYDLLPKMDILHYSWKP